MGVARIPLLDFDLLHSEVERIRPTLPASLLERDQSGTTCLFFNKNHTVLKSLFKEPSFEVQTGPHTVAGILTPTKMSKRGKGMVINR